VQRDPDVLAAAMEEALVMVSVDTGFYYGVSDVAREIWNAIENPRKVADLIEELAVAYNVDQSVCEEQTLSFLEDLLTENLLQVIHGPTK
jgi:hypothetical protein